MLANRPHNIRSPSLRKNSGCFAVLRACNIVQPPAKGYGNHNPRWRGQTRQNAAISGTYKADPHETDQRLPRGRVRDGGNLLHRPASATVI